MKIDIRVIGDEQQRYPTAGDYWLDDQGVLQVRVSRQKDRRYEWLLILHELVEAMLCMEHKIDFDRIDDFDIEWEASSNLGEPGDSPNAPYHEEHRFATQIEHLMAYALNVNWHQYLDHL